MIESLFNALSMERAVPALTKIIVHIIDGTVHLKGFVAFQNRNNMILVILNSSGNRFVPFIASFRDITSSFRNHTVSWVQSVRRTSRKNSPQSADSSRRHSAGWKSLTVCSNGSMRTISPAKSMIADLKSCPPTMKMSKQS